MLTYNERIELRDKLQNGEIEIDFAIEQYWKDYKEGQKSWHSNDWKERRAKIIKDKCEICGSKDTLTLQHRSHPQKYSEYLRELTRAYAEARTNTNSTIDKSEFNDYVRNKYDYIAVPLCPNCKCSNPKKRVRKIPQYRCSACHQEFDTPNFKSIDELISIFYENEYAMEVRDKCFISKDRWKNKHSLSNIKYCFQRERTKDENSETIKKEAFLLYLNDDIKYLSFEDSITACKRCASNYDLYSMELCPECKENYKSIQYPTCIQCLPEEKRKELLEMIELGNEMREMHNEQGIE